MSDHSQQNGLPASWVWTSIREIANTQTGGTPSRTEPEYFGGNTPWVKSGELGDGYVYETEETISERGLTESNAKLLPAGTLCIALYGATVGKLGILGISAATNQAVCGITLPSVVNTGYVFRYLESIRPSLIAQGKGGAQSNISNGIVRNTRVPLAPANEQRRIVERIEELFSDLDAGVAALERARANLKRYRASVLKAAVEGNLTAELRAKQPKVEAASKLLERILKERRRKWEADQLAKFAAVGKQPPKNWQAKYVEPPRPETTNLPFLPDGWCWTRLSQVALFQNGHAFPSKEYSDSGVRLIRPGNLFDDGSVRWTEKNTRYLPTAWADKNAAYIVRGGELVMNLTAQSLKDEFLGRTCATDADEFCLLNQRLARITPCAHLQQQYLLTVLKSRLFRQFANGLNTGSLIQHMFTSQLDDFVMPLPPFREQGPIVAAIADKFSQIQAADAAIDHGLLRAARLRQSILKQAFEGKLVPQDPSDEAASALFDRLKAEHALSGRNGDLQRRRRGKRDLKKHADRPR